MGDTKKAAFVSQKSVKGDAYIIDIGRVLGWRSYFVLYSTWATEARALGCEKLTLRTPRGLCLTTTLTMIRAYAFNVADLLKLKVPAVRPMLALDTGLWW